MGFDPFCSCDLGQVASHGSYPHREIAPSRLMIQAVRVKVSAPGTEGKLVLFCFFFFLFLKRFFGKGSELGWISGQTSRRWDSNANFRATGAEAGLDASHSWGPWNLLSHPLQAPV